MKIRSMSTHMVRKFQKYLGQREEHKRFQREKPHKFYTKAQELEWFQISQPQCLKTTWNKYLQNPQGKLYPEWNLMPI